MAELAGDFPRALKSSTTPLSLFFCSGAYLCGTTIHLAVCAPRGVGVSCLNLSQWPRRSRFFCLPSAVEEFGPSQKVTRDKITTKLAESFLCPLTSLNFCSAFVFNDASAGPL